MAERERELNRCELDRTGREILIFPTNKQLRAECCWVVKYATKPLTVISAFITRFMVGQYVTVHGEVISHVNISRTQAEDGGLYSCSATNRAGTASHSTRLNVYGES